MSWWTITIGDTVVASSPNEDIAKEAFMALKPCQRHGQLRLLADRQIVVMSAE